MYMGSIESQKMKMWVLSEDKLSIEEEEVEFIPGLYKIFDELLVNAGDNL
jgi:DNA topoisomerase-2